jgi:hypothetical protein
MFFRIITALSLCVGTAELPAASQIIQNDVFWKDLSGNPIYSQGGGVFKFADTYYWYGVKYEGAVTYCKNPAKKVANAVFSAVTCYSSKDLVNWKFENNVLSAETGGTLDPSIWVGRLGVAYNGNTKKYVLVTQYQGTPNTTQLFATCSTPGGKFTIDHTQAVIENVVNNNAGDQTIFVDDDGKAYLVFSNQNGRANTYVAPLRASDFLAVEPAKKVFGGAGREGNCMFKYKGRYYICSSDLHGWNASHCYYISATDIFGPYSTEAIMENTDLDFCHVTQTGFFITVNGTKDTTVLFCGDRWSDFAGNGLGYNQWCPLSFNGNLPVFNSLSQFKIDAEAGTWNTEMGNNYLLNPSFEADRVSQTSLAGWTNAANASGSHASGNFCLQQTASGTSYQNISNIPNGTYTLTAWVQSSGGQTTCNVFATNFGGSEMSYTINKAISSWTQISIPGIIITNGKCQVGIYSVANANNWCKIDDISLVNSSLVGVTRFQATRQIQMQSKKPLFYSPFSIYQSSRDNTQFYSLSGKQLGNIITEHGNMISLKSSYLAKGIYFIKTAQ